MTPHIVHKAQEQQLWLPRFTYKKSLLSKPLSTPKTAQNGDARGYGAHDRGLGMASFIESFHSLDPGPCNVEM
jgi:hypothetical protein